jgi:hypothetical protein
MTPPPEIILKFPSPYNAGKVTYKDKSNTCYKYRAENVPCTADAKNGIKITPQPILEDFKIADIHNKYLNKN